MAVEFSDIAKARDVLDGVIADTPIMPDRRLSSDLGTEVYLKAECLQRSGSFKIRGAYNKISQLTDEERKRGVIAASAGNHAQGVALAASLMGDRVDDRCSGVRSAYENKRYQEIWRKGNSARR